MVADSTGVFGELLASSSVVQLLFCCVSQRERTDPPAGGLSWGCRTTRSVCPSPPFAERVAVMLAESSRMWN